MHKKLMSLSVLIPLLTGLLQAQVIPTGPTTLESYDKPGYYMVAPTASAGAVGLVQGGNATAEGQWTVMTPGNTAAAGTVSFQPVSLANHFMRHRGYVFYCDTAATDNLYLNDSTFTVVPGLADPTAVSFRSVNYTTMYLMHNTANPIGLVLQAPAAGNEGAATWKFPPQHPELATEPVPEDEATDVSRTTALGWTAGAFAAAHNVYFGTNFDDVNTASKANPKGVLVSQDQTETTFTPSQRLEFNTTYYWRIDEVNAPPTNNTVFTGTVWSFTTEPFAYAVDANSIAATASSQKSVNEGPVNTINGSGMTGDLADVNSKAMWISLSTKSGGKMPAWIRYDFDKLYKLHEMWVWNYNGSMELDMGVGAMNTTIEYSVDGENWLTLGAFEFAQGIAADDYAHNTTVPFNGLAVKSVRITINETWGYPYQTGLSEVRFYYIPVWAREPNPATDSNDVDPTTVALSWRSGREAASHNVYVGTDANALTKVGSPTADSFAPANLQLETRYYWRVDEVNQTTDPTTWTGDVWNFGTLDFLTVDDMESYDAADRAIFNIWSDGYNTTTNGAQVGYGQALNDTFCETGTVHGGSQSMPFLYGVGNIATSEVSRAYTPAQNWTAAGAKTLTLFFHGTAGNATSQLYVKINDKKVNYPGDLAILATPIWKQWNIDLSTVTGVNAVSSFTIGMSGPGGGTLLIDDIRLYKTAPAPIVPANPGTTGLVAYYAMEGDAKDSAGTNNGTATDVTFADSVMTSLGKAAVFGGSTSYIDLGTGFGTSVVSKLSSTTIAAWVNYVSGGGQWERVIDFGTSVTSGNPQVYMYLCARNAGTSPRFAITTGSSGGESGVNSSKSITAGWHHLAGVIDSAAMTITLYMDGTQVATGATTKLPKDLGATNQNWIGRSQWSGDALLTGSVDDLKVFNRVLSVGEIAYMTGDR